MKKTLTQQTTEDIKKYFDKNPTRKVVILMASTSETGHAINISNYKLLIDKNVGFGADYSPTTAEIKTPAMMTIWNNAKNAQTALNTALGDSKTPTGDRQDYFDPMSKIVTRSYNIAITDPHLSGEIKDNLKSQADKFRGVHHNHPLPPPTPENPTPHQISTSHMSYVQRTNTFEAYLAILNPLVSYNPGDADLKKTALAANLLEMQTINDSYGTNVVVPVENALNHRNEVLYEPITGMLDNAQLSKNQSKGHFGPDDARTHTVTSIQFRRPAND